MRQYPFCNKNCVNFGIKLDAEISIWMQSEFYGFDISATLFINTYKSANSQLFPEEIQIVPLQCFLQEYLSEISRELYELSPDRLLVL